MSIPTCILFWDAAGNVVGTLDHMVQYDDDGKPLGLVDFEAHELAGGRLREIAEASNAVGAGTWPEWLGMRAHDFRVVVRPGPKGGTHSITEPEHKTSGHRRQRVEVAEAIAARISDEDVAAQAEARQKRPVWIGDLVGGPDRYLQLDDDGRTVPRVPSVRPNLPLLPIEPEMVTRKPPTPAEAPPVLGEVIASRGASPAGRTALR